MADEPKKVRGPALRWSPADYARMAKVTQADVTKAKRRYERSAPAKVKKLLD